MASQERTESATPRRRQDARERGQVARSSDVNAIIVFLTVLVLVRVLTLREYHTVADLCIYYWGALDQIRVSPDTVMAGTITAIVQSAYVLWPVMLAAAAAALAANVMQVGFVFAPKVIRLDASRLNPMNGLKRLFSLRAGVELLKALLKILVVAYMAYSTLWGSRHLLFVLPEQTVAGVMLIVCDIAYRVCLKAGLALLVLALADYGFQRWQHERDLRMTRQELRDEYKRQEGDPLLKQRIRQRQRELARRRMMAEVPKADVVITNPTHLAVALRYDPAHMDAPCVVAKGERALAERIRDIAREAGVPVIENKELAQALYRLVPVGGVIPSQLFEAVAQILAYVYRIRGKTPAFSSAA